MCASCTDSSHSGKFAILKEKAHDFVKANMTYLCSLEYEMVSDVHKCANVLCEATEKLLTLQAVFCTKC